MVRAAVLSRSDFTATLDQLAKIGAFSEVTESAQVERVKRPDFDYAASRKLGVWPFCLHLRFLLYCSLELSFLSFFLFLLLSPSYILLLSFLPLYHILLRPRRSRRCCRSSTSGASSSLSLLAMIVLSTPLSSASSRYCFPWCLLPSDPCGFMTVFYHVRAVTMVARKRRYLRSCSSTASPLSLPLLRRARRTRLRRTQIRVTIFPLLLPYRSVSFCSVSPVITFSHDVML